MKNKESIEKNKGYFDSWSKCYDSLFFQIWMKKFHKPILDSINCSKKLKILDISCGTGELLKELHQKCPILELQGMDLSENMLAAAKKKLPSTIELRRGDVHNLPYHDNYFDLVMTTEAFHHYYDQAKALQEMIRVAKNNGKIIVNDINFLLRPIHYLFETLEPGCVKVNSRREMRELFEKTKLTNICQKRNFLFSVITSGVKDTII